MTFRSRSIRKTPSKKILKTFKQSFNAGCQKIKNTDRRLWSYVLGGMLVVLGFFVVLKATFAAYHFVANFSLGTVTSALGSELVKDEQGHTNLVLLGDGGYERDGAGLVDSIMVASIDHENKGVTLLSIPRDYFISQEVEGYRGRINALGVSSRYSSENERFEAFKVAAGKIANLDIHYYVRVDFNAFVQVVDALGGITVDVEEAIYDTTYPNKTDNGYIPFQIGAGLQEMNGETALKYARSRHTSSDFGRSQRQQQLLEAIREKAMSTEVLTSPGTLTNLYESVKSNMNTDMTLRELISLAGLATEFDRSRLVTKVLHDDFTREGGFLYTPERELYGGQFVLVPYGNNLELIHRYTDLLFNHRELYAEAARIEVLNATRRTGIASDVDETLSRFGFNVIETGNFTDETGERQYLETSRIIHYKWSDQAQGAQPEDSTEESLPTHEATVEALQDFVSASVFQESPLNRRSAADIVIVLGDDYVNKR